MSPGDTLDVVVLPWLGIDKPHAVLDFDFLPATVAAERHPGFGNALRAATSYFFDHHRVNDPWNESAPTRLVPVEPCVIVLEDESQLARAHLATQCLFFAVLLDNTRTYANGANFRQFHVSLSAGFDGFARRTRTMFGSRLLGTRPTNALEVRPLWCGEWHEPDADALSLAERALPAENAESLRRCLAALSPATYDSDEYEIDLERSLYALALERLLHREGQEYGRWWKQRNLSRAALGETLSTVRRMTTPPLFSPRMFDLIAPATNEILRYIREERNDFWHPEQQGKRALSEQQAVSPNLVAFRALSAVILCCMAKLIDAPLPARLANYVAAVEEWCEELPSMYDQDASVPISRFGQLWTRYNLRSLTEDQPTSPP